MKSILSGWFCHHIQSSKYQIACITYARGKDASTSSAHLFLVVCVTLLWKFLYKGRVPKPNSIEREKGREWGRWLSGLFVILFTYLFIYLIQRMFLGAPDVRVWPSELRCTSCEHSSSSHVAFCGCQPAKCSMEAAVSGPAVSPWSPAFDPMWAAKCTDSPALPPPFCLQHD